MENKQAIMNIKQGKNIPYKHETIATLITMANKLEKIEQMVNDITYKSDPILTKWAIRGILLEQE